MRKGMSAAPLQASTWLRRNRSMGLVAAVLSCACLGLVLLACNESSSSLTPSGPSPEPTPTPNPGGSSPYAGNWTFTTKLTAIGNQCGHSGSDIGVLVGPVAVTVSGNGSFSVPSPVNASGTIRSADDVVLTLAAQSSTCIAGEGHGGCTSVNHCDGTSVQAGDVSKWVLERIK